MATEDPADRQRALGLHPAAGHWMESVRSIERWKDTKDYLFS